jgi:hypothetical protein
MLGVTSHIPIVPYELKAELRSRASQPRGILQKISYYRAHLKEDLQMQHDPDDPNAVAKHVMGLPIRPESKVGMILDSMQRNLDGVDGQIPTLTTLAWRSAFCILWAAVLLVAVFVEPLVIRTEPFLSLVSWMLVLLLVGFLVRFFYLATKTARLYVRLKRRL